MSFVNLASGGLDSTLIGVMAKSEGVEHYPLFIDYGQRAASKEWAVCQQVHERFGLPEPKKMDISGYGTVIRSGLTDPSLDVRVDAFTPGRNLMFLLMGAAYAYQLGASSVAIGLLAEQFSLFPDQTSSFIRHAEATITHAMGREIRVLTPLMGFGKHDVVRLAESRGLSGTYSCHLGGEKACGHCISCSEFK